MQLTSFPVIHEFPEPELVQQLIEHKKKEAELFEKFKPKEKSSKFSGGKIVRKTQTRKV
jgi:hypothetical protein